jgi:hypothetical protein
MDFEHARQQEHKSEREILVSKKRKDEEEEWLHKQMQIYATIDWHTPPCKYFWLFNNMLVIAMDFKKCETSSTAFTTENEREKAVLMVYYFEGEQQPTTPTEIDYVPPDYDDSQVKSIPFQEIVCQNFVVY